MSNRRNIQENDLYADVPLPPFEDLLRDKVIAESYILNKLELLTQEGWWDWFLDQYLRESQTDPELAYPSQGLIKTNYDEPRDKTVATEKLSHEFFTRTIHAWLYYLELFNHPDRIRHLIAAESNDFDPPADKGENPIFGMAKMLRQAISISELGLHVGKSDEDRTKRTERFEQGPFVKLGRHARSVFVGSANPDIWGSLPAVTTMAQAHSLVGIPRDGFFSNIERQTDFATQALEWLEKSPILKGRSVEDQAFLLESWKHNLMGVIEAEPKKALRRAKALYESGLRTFRIYSPEPGQGPLRTLQALRELEQQEGWEPIEIFVGQVVDVSQAQALEAAGADGIYIGIGGGGRCTTGVRSGSAIDWPQLVWELRGKISIPIIVEGGGSDNVGQTLAVGATGIGVTRAAGGGTIESPGGSLYFVDDDGRYYNYYRGEASAGMKAMGDRIGPFGIIPYVEGESTQAFLDYGPGDVPTIMQRLFLLNGDAIMALVFQNVSSIPELQDVGADSLVRVTPEEVRQRNTH